MMLIIRCCRRRNDLEIERKFQVIKMPEALDRYKKIEIEQGYLSSKPTIRIRKADERHILTVKSKFGVCKKEGDPIVNNEHEFEITEKEYEHLKAKLKREVLRKTRYLIPLEDGLVVELDIFTGRHKGLIFAEVEFPSVEKANSFNKPDWLGEDVTDDNRYKNSQIIKLDEYSEDYFKERL